MKPCTFSEQEDVFILVKKGKVLCQLYRQPKLKNCNWVETTQAIVKSLSALTDFDLDWDNETGGVWRCTEIEYAYEKIAEYPKELKGYKPVQVTVSKNVSYEFHTVKDRYL